MSRYTHSPKELLPLFLLFRNQGWCCGQERDCYKPSSSGFVPFSYDGGMRWKGAFAVLLAAIFLPASSWTTVCELACAGVAQRHVCPICGSSSHTAAAHMHCAHMDGQESSKGAHIGLTASSECSHVLCKQPASESLPTKVFQSDQLKWTVLRPSADLENGIILARYIDKGPPPILVDSGRPLTVALRI
jgi:hypothetical protein